MEGYIHHDFAKLRYDYWHHVICIIIIPNLKLTWYDIIYIMNWFKLHLNWALIIIWIGGGVFISALAGLSPFPLLTFSLLLIYTIGLIMSCGWFLREKRRNLLYLLWLLTGLLGFIIILCLENKKPACNKIL